MFTPRSVVALSVCAVLLGACEAASTDKDTAETNPSADTGPTDGDDTAVPDGDDDDDEAANTLHRVHHVITDIEVAGRTEGIDLDGDSTADNALWVLGPLIDPLTDNIDENAVVMILQVATDGELSEASRAWVGLLAGADQDGDRLDNDSGTESFAVADLDADGLAPAGVDVPLAAGHYTAVLADESIQVGALTFQAATGLHIDGQVSVDTHTGLLGFAMPIERLTDLTELLGSSEDAGELQALADIDTDGDGTPDAISIVFAFSTTPCGVDSQGQ